MILNVLDKKKKAKNNKKRWKMYIYKKKNSLQVLEKYICEQIFI